MWRFHATSSSPEAPDTEVIDCTADDEAAESGLEDGGDFDEEFVDRLINNTYKCNCSAHKWHNRLMKEINRVHLNNNSVYINN